jgi:TPR repeat protein
MNRTQSAPRLLRGALIAVVFAVSANAALADESTQGGVNTVQLQTRAQSGDPDALYQLGTLSLAGLGVVQDYVAARKYLEQAATQGNAGAACELGLLYQTATYADGPPVDLNQAAKWYGVSAAKGDAYGEFALAGLYQSGLGVAKDTDKAAELYAQAAAQGVRSDTATTPLDQLFQHFIRLASTISGQTI